MGKFSKGPSSGELIAQQEAAAANERKKIEAESAEKQAAEDKQLKQAYESKQSQRKAFVGGEQQDDTVNRRKFLKGV